MKRLYLVEKPIINYGGNYIVYDILTDEVNEFIKTALKNNLTIYHNLSKETFNYINSLVDYDLTHVSYIEEPRFESGDYIISPAVNDKSRFLLIIKI